MTSKISAVPPILVSKTLFLGEFECFVPFLCVLGPKKKFPSEKNDESQRVSPSLYFETRKLVFLGLRDHTKHIWMPLKFVDKRQWVLILKFYFEHL